MIVTIACCAPGWSGLTGRCVHRKRSIARVNTKNCIDYTIYLPVHHHFILSTNNTTTINNKYL